MERCVSVELPASRKVNIVANQAMIRETCPAIAILPPGTQYPSRALRSPCRRPYGSGEPRPRRYTRPATREDTAPRLTCWTFAGRAR
jgi:hypothetical protein